MNPPDDDINPYQAPSAASYSILPAQQLVGDETLVRLVRKFRQQMHGLGGLWVVVALVEAWVATLLVNTPSGLPRGPIVLIALASGIVWILLAIFTVGKRLWAVDAAICLCFATLGAIALLWVVVGRYSFFMVQVAVALVPGIIQGFRVRRWGKRLLRSGIPLTIRPEEVGLYHLPHQ